MRQLSSWVFWLLVFFTGVCVVYSKPVPTWFIVGMLFCIVLDLICAVRLPILHFIVRFLPHRDIVGSHGELYMRRYRIFGWLPGDKSKSHSLYLHRFYLPDPARPLHTHPWTYAVSFILAGGYIERRDVSVTFFTKPALPGAVYRERFIRPGVFSLLRSTDAHRVVALRGCETWTLFFAGPKTGSWGFVVPGRGLVDWRTYLAEIGVPVDY